MGEPRKLSGADLLRTPEPVGARRRLPHWSNHQFPIPNYHSAPRDLRRKTSLAQRAALLRALAHRLECLHGLSRVRLVVLQLLRLLHFAIAGVEWRRELPTHGGRRGFLDATPH